MRKKYNIKLEIHEIKENTFGNKIVAVQNLADVDIFAVLGALKKAKKRTKRNDLERFTQ